jgi:cytidylate kinase
VKEAPIVEDMAKSATVSIAGVFERNESEQNRYIVCYKIDTSVFGQ